MSFNKRVAHPPLSRNNNAIASGSNINNNKNLSRPPSRINQNTTFANAGVGTGPASASSSTDEAFSKVPGLAAAPPSPSKDRIRMAGMRWDGVGGSHVKQKGDEESNIQVAVRIKGKGPSDPPTIQSILTTSGPHCSSVNVQMESNPSISSRNVALNSVQSNLVNDGNSRDRSYTFDHVFGPEADQGMVYQSVVAPVLNEVMCGYNCTVFAYGQTGTGKTHTMEGDLTSQMGTYSPEAGVIPRTLYRLFHTLEMSKDEFSVHASFIELYNEELRDLLSDEVPQPLGSGKDSNGLRIYEERGKGVAIQGLEDVPMRDAEHGLRLLRKGSQKRQIAATRCNESSSRSHCVFTLTVHIKETTAKGEDVLRTGKLNLVDLAGSENIGRSGAENKRAREAGMINQSLLTLGRVINALVEKSSHIPYRESKLTRLLQESLGGRTKTCIIATVSPERNDLEETLSTLDYALRAKSIRNKPEVNQKMTRAALIKEYVNEIERLKGDLLASREKNGIFLSPESWQSMQDEHDLARQHVEELRRQGAVVESKMVSLKEQFEQNMQLLVKREAEAKNVRLECDEKEQEVQKIVVQINELQKAAIEEQTLRSAYRQSEKKLDGVAKGLRELFHQSSSDVGGLFAKLDRKTKIERKNRDVVAECQASIASMSNQLESRVADFGSTHEQFTMDLSMQLREFQQREGEKLLANRKSVEEKLQAMQSLSEIANNDQQEIKSAIDNMIEEIRQESNSLIANSQERSEILRNECQVMSLEVATNHRETLQGIRQGVDEIGELVVSVLKQFKERSNSEKKALEEINILSNESMQKELNRLSNQNEKLIKIITEEREKSTLSREVLCKNITSLVTSFSQQREQQFGNVIDEIRHGNAIAQDQVQGYSRKHSNQLEELLEENAKLREDIKEKEKIAKSLRIQNESGLNASTSTIERQMQQFGNRFFINQEEMSDQTNKTLKAIASRVDGICQIADSNRQIKETNLARAKIQIDSALNEIVEEIQSTLEDVEETCEGVIEGVDEYRLMGSTFIKDQNLQLSSIRSTSKEYLSKQIISDVSTGTTPQKRDWPTSMPTWNLVSNPSNADDSMADIDGDLVEQIETKNLTKSGELINQQLTMRGKEKTNAAVTNGTIRPSLPISNTPSMPLGERTMNRFSMQPATSAIKKPTSNGTISKTRAPSSVQQQSGSTTASKRARQ